MVKEITMYQCGICKKKYSNLKEAEECEKQGVEKAKFKIGDKYNFVTSYIRGNDYQDDYEGIESIRIKNIIESHTCIYICEVWDDSEECWYMDDYEIEGNNYFEVWNRGKVESL